MIFLFRLFAIFLFITPALAQQTVITKPFVASTTNYSSTVTTTNNFQTVIPQNANRGSCTVQNKGSNQMWVFFGPATSATKNLSIVLDNGQSVSCIAGSIVLKDEIAITGTGGDAFFAASQ